MAADEQPEDLKLMVIGDSKVGKSCFILSYIDKIFIKRLGYGDNATGAKYSIHGKSFYINFADSHGAPEYDKIRPLSYSFSDVFLICFDVSNRDSFESIESKWIPSIGKGGFVPKDTPFIIVGCKDDLRNENSAERNILIHAYSRVYVETIPSDVVAIIGMHLGNYSKIDVEAHSLINKYTNAHKYMVCSALEMRGLKEIVRVVAELHLAPPKKSGNTNCIIL